MSVEDLTIGSGYSILTFRTTGINLSGLVGSRKRQRLVYRKIKSGLFISRGGGE